PHCTVNNIPCNRTEHHVIAIQYKLIMVLDAFLNPGAIITPIKPIWYFHPILSFPLNDQSNDVLGALTNVMLLFRLHVNLHEVFSPSMYNQKSLQEDQFGIFNQVERNIDNLGMHGHDCVLRFICEMNGYKFAQSSIIGQIITLMFTPATDTDSSSILDEYLEANLAGQKGTNVTEICESLYSRCGVSVFAALEKFQSQWGGSAATSGGNIASSAAINNENYLSDKNILDDELQSLNDL
ncbi:unnamed protein product, partial [Meganyctiphanes norvegica]